MRNVRIAAALAVSALAAAGCGGSGGSGGGTAAAGGAKIPAFAENFKPPASGCGSFTAKAPADPDGVVAALDQEHQDALGGYADFPGSTVKVLKSRWADWKPSHPGPYTVAVSWGQLVSDFQVQLVDNLKKDLADTKGVGEVEVRTTGSNLDIAQQLQQYNGLVQKKPDLIILETPSPDSFNGPVQKAADQGIPTVTLLSPVPVDGAVNVDGNNYLAAAEGASYLTKVLGGKGNVLAVRALATAPVDSQVNTGWRRVIDSCPGMKVAGEAFGAFTEAAAKSETLKYLGTHPGKLDGVAIMPGEAVGVLQAFKQTGRPVPPAAEVGMDKGFFGYWQQNQARLPRLVDVAAAGARRAGARGGDGPDARRAGGEAQHARRKGPGGQRRHAGGLGRPEVDPDDPRHRLGQGRRLPALQGARRVLREPGAAGIAVSRAAGRRAAGRRWRPAARP